MTLELDGKAFDIDWMFYTSSDKDSVMLQYRDARSLEAIAHDFDGVEHMVRRSETQGDMTFDGFSRLTAIIRHSGDVVQLNFSKAKGGDG